MLIYDVVIVGGGIVGAVTALAIAHQTALKIAIVESKQPVFQGLHDQRVSAISLASKSIFQHLDIWPSITAEGLSAYTKMHVWDAGSTGKVDFDVSLLGEPALGYIVSDSLIRKILLNHIQFNNKSNNSHNNILDFLCPMQVNQVKEKIDYIELVTDTEEIIRTQLLIGADGAHSWIRDQANIDIDYDDYGHTAIVTTVTTEFSHEKTAWQRFLPTGPVAFLPLIDPYQSSIVWSVHHLNAAHLLSLDDASFSQALSDAFDHQLGKIHSIGSRISFKLSMRHAKDYVKSRIALVGDAAHTLHPLAGQGVNLGLLDAASLADVIVDAYHAHRDFFSRDTLRRYARWRKADTLLMLNMVKKLSILFGSDKKSVSQLRGFGLHLTNQSTFFKKMLAEYATGKRGDLPRLAREIYPLPIIG